MRISKGGFSMNGEAVFFAWVTWGIIYFTNT